MEKIQETKIYNSADEQLFDYFKLVKLLIQLQELRKNEHKTIEKASENPDDQKKQDKNPLVQAKELNDIYRNIVKQKASIGLVTEATLKDAKVRLPLEIMRKRYKLTQDEIIILCALALQAIDPLASVQSEKANLLYLVSEGEYYNALLNIRLLDSGSPLRKNNLIKRGYGMRDIELGHGAEKFIYSSRAYKTASGKGDMPFVVISPQEIYSRLSKSVIGQEKAKRMIAVAAHAHLKRISAKKGALSPGKSNIMLIGPTGSGKTLLARTLAEIMDVPVIIVDATEYTEKGYVGGDVDDMIEQLYDAARGDRARAEKGIIFIDEIDKIAARDIGGSHRTGKDVSGKSVQEELLRFLEGTTITASTERGFKHHQIDMTNILFIAGGAFPDMKNDCSSSRQVMGFDVAKDYRPARMRVHSELAEELINYGMIPEFVGRFPILVELSELNKSELLDIIKIPANSLINQYRSLYGGISFSDDALEFIVEQSIKRKVGARGLRAILEETLSPIFFERAIDDKNEELTLTKDDLLKRA